MAAEALNEIRQQSYLNPEVAKRQTKLNQKNISFSRFLIGNKSLTQQNFAKLTFQSAIKVKKPSIPDTQKLSRNQKQTV
jgi:uncharacterized membrane protein